MNFHYTHMYSQMWRLSIGSRGVDGKAQDRNEEKVMEVRIGQSADNSELHQRSSLLDCATCQPARAGLNNH
jgi:hypothetical protein